MHPVPDKRESIELFRHVMRALFRALGCASAKSIRLPQQNGPFPAFVFELPNRRGHYTVTRDMRAWLVRGRDAATDDERGELADLEKEGRAMS